MRYSDGNEQWAVGHTGLGLRTKIWPVDTHFRLSVYIVKVMGRDEIKHLGII